MDANAGFVDANRALGEDNRRSVDANAPSVGANNRGLDANAASGDANIPSVGLGGVAAEAGGAIFDAGQRVAGVSRRAGDGGGRGACGLENCRRAGGLALIPGGANRKSRGRGRLGIPSPRPCAKGLGLLAACLALLCAAPAARAAGGEAGHGLDPFVLLAFGMMLLVAKLGGELFARLRQPAVLGELIGGMAVGALSLAGVGWVDVVRTDAVIAALAEFGVIILLFEVGLESNVREMAEVGLSALLAAVLGVVAPFILGWGVAYYFLPGGPTLVHVFIGATLCATSVGITARVLRDLGRLQTRESRIILGAAVIDDVLGLLVLAVVAGAIRAQAAGGALAAWDVAAIAAKSVAFLAAALLAGRFVVPRLFGGAGRMRGRGVLVTVAVAFCFLLAWAAARVGLAPIVGAFAAGLVLDEVHFEAFVRRGEQRLNELLSPVSALLVPIFFVLMGLRVDLSVFGRSEVLGFACVLTLAAVVGKQLCAAGVVERGVNRLAVGLGMIPRGEVGLIFAGIGASLMLPGAGGAPEPVVGPATFGAVVIMVIVTTLVTPPFLKWSLQREEGRAVNRES